jgi:hypothetical protein
MVATLQWQAQPSWRLEKIPNSHTVLCVMKLWYAVCCAPHRSRRVPYIAYTTLTLVVPALPQPNTCTGSYWCIHQSYYYYYLTGSGPCLIAL